MQRKFLNARSPLRLLEKNLHGGLGRGNLGVVLAGHGVGKTSFLVGVAVVIEFGGYTRTLRLRSISPRISPSFSRCLELASSSKTVS